jgi:hypothetical protein
VPGLPFPLYHVFHDLADTQPHPPPRVSHPDRIAALQVTTAAGVTRLLLANLTPQPQTTQIAGFDRTRAPRVTPGATTAPLAPEVRLATDRTRFILDRGSDGLATCTLPPYGYARIDLE